MIEKVEISASLPKEVVDLESYLRHEFEQQDKLYKKYKKDTNGTDEELSQRGFDPKQVKRYLTDMDAVLKKLEHAQVFLKNGNNLRAVQIVQSKINELNEEVNKALTGGRILTAKEKMADINILRKLIK